MPSTPPPPRRIHTPPTPLHGPRYDSHEPYSPRRSSRVAAQRNRYSHHQQRGSSSSQHRFGRASTPTNDHKHTLSRTSSQIFSPPASPTSPLPQRVSKSPTYKSIDPRPPLIDGAGMLPTPSKTPKKRPAQPQASLGATARVLFPSRPATIEDAMPSPRKSVKSKRHAAFSLSQLMEDSDEEASSSKIEIYTDTKDRVPSLDEGEDNPFVGPRKTRARARASRKISQAKRGDSNAHGEEEAGRMEEAVENGEGLIYVFRGKKIFRRFEEPEGTPSADEDSDNPNELDIRRKAGAASRRPFTRSSVKPRLLWPSDAQRHEREEEAAAEEALTDIELPVPASSPKKHFRSRVEAPSSSNVHEEKAVVTPVKQRFRHMTPPSTVRPTRSSVKKEAELKERHATPEELQPIEPPVFVPPTRGKKVSPFDMWRRTKSGEKTAPKGTKREASPMEREETGKRTRSGAYAAS